MIEFMNSNGERVSLSRSQYFETILSPNFELYANNPDALASTIINALENEFYHALVGKAAQQLIKIDAIVERAICLYGTFLLKTNHFIEAEALFLDFLEKNPPHPTVLLNLAKAQDFLNKLLEALKTLEKSLILDPNQEAAFDYWLAIKKEMAEEQGLSPEEAKLISLEEGNSRFGGWRSKLALGTYYVNKHDKEVACEYYEAVLKDHADSFVLMSISAALGKNGFLNEAISLIEPRYNPYEHDFFIGLNLLQVYFELNKLEEGKALLSILNSLANPSLNSELSRYQALFLKLKKEIDSGLKGSFTLDFEYIHYPLWCYGWNIKHDLDSSRTGKKIGILQFSSQLGEGKIEARFEEEERGGKLARSIPLFLLENLSYGSNALAHLILPINKKTKTYILYNFPLGREQIMPLVNKGYEAIVTGMILPNQLEIFYWSLLTGNCHKKTFEINLSDIQKVIPSIEAFIFEIAEIKFDAHFKNNKTGFRYIESQYIDDYLMLTAHQLSFYRGIKNNDFINLSPLINGFIKLSKETQSLQISLNLISIIHLSMKNQSSGIRAHQKIVIEWLNSLIVSPQILSSIAKKTGHLFKNYLDS